MSYTIYKSNGLQLLTLLDGTLDTSTGLNLVGKNYINYGTVQNENFVWLLENQASATAPLYPLTGQLWYDTATATLKYYDGTAFNSLASAGTSSVTVGQLETRLTSNVAALYAGLTANVITVTGLITAANTAMKLYVDTNNATQLSQITSANSAISDIQANVGSFYTWANANYGSSNYSNATVAAYLPVSTVITGINANVTAVTAAIVSANVAMQLYVADLNGAQITRVTGANASIATLLANVGSFYTWANANYGTSNYGNANIAAYLPTSAVITGINSNVANVVYSVTDLDSSLRAYIDTGNVGVNDRFASGAASIALLSANVGAFQTYANTTFGTSSYSNVNVAAYLPTSTIIANINSNVTAAISAIGDANIRMKDYVDAGNLIVSNRISTVANAATSLQANLQAFQTYANTTANTASNTAVIATTAFVQNVVPTNGIILWHGADTNVPYGWRICDGTNSTPSLGSPVSGVYYIKKII